MKKYKSKNEKEFGRSTFSHQELLKVKIHYYFWPIKMLIAILKMITFGLIAIPAIFTTLIYEFFALILDSISTWTWNNQKTFINPKSIWRRRNFIKNIEEVK